MIGVQTDFFGRHQAHRRKAKRTEIFDLATDLSPAERQEVANILEGYAAGDRSREKLAIEAGRYARCGQDAIGFVCPDCSTEYYVRCLCRSRICERCGRIYRKQLERKILPAIKNVSASRRKGYTLALVTLTINSKRFGVDLPNRDHIKQLYRETSEFFRLFYGKYAGKRSRTGKINENRKRFIGAGWIATIELGNDNNNAHCHAIVYGPIRMWHKLRSAWEAITGDSRGVDIRKIHNPSDVIGYVLKYVTKPPVTESYNRIADYAVMIKGSRRLRSGGIFYNQFTLPKSSGGGRCTCVFCSSILRHDGYLEIDRAVECRVDLNAGWRQVRQKLEPIEKIESDQDGAALSYRLPI